MNKTNQTRHILMQFYDSLFDRFGPQHWWPAESQTEVVIGAVLTQNTSWTNVEKAIENLRREGRLDFGAIFESDTEQLAEWIRPSGYYNLKANRLKSVATFVVNELDGILDRLKVDSLDVSRNRLLGVNGIGPETADSILLYALNRPSFVVDAYTRRILLRHNLIDATAKYDDIKRLFEMNLPADPILYNEYHALIVRACKDHCRHKADCADCPLAFHPHDETALNNS